MAAAAVQDGGGWAHGPGKAQEDAGGGGESVVQALRAENAELKKRLQQERGMRHLYAKKLEEAEEEWLQQMEQLQAYVQCVRASLYETEEASVLCRGVDSDAQASGPSTKPNAVIMQSAPGGAISMEKLTRTSSSNKPRAEEPLHQVVGDLKDSFDAKANVLADDVAFIQEVREGVSQAPEMDPELELQELIRKFKLWKREFKDQLKVAADSIKRKGKEQNNIRQKSSRGPHSLNRVPTDGVPDGDSLSANAQMKKKVSFMKRLLRRTAQDS